MTRYSDVLPSEANLETKLTEQVSLNVPILSSDMDTVTESEMAIAMAPSVGGLDSLHKELTTANQGSG